MSNRPLNIGEEAKVQMPMKTVASLIVIVAMGVWGYFGIVEKLNQHSTRLELMEKDLTENTDFRIKWPRGQLGSLPADSEQFMMIEDLYKTTDKLNAHIENMALNKVNIEFLRKQMDKVLSDIEKLNSNSTKLELMQKDLIENTEFRIKWPRGQLGSLPADSEQFMMIEDLYKTTDKLNMHIESMALNKINIEFLTKQLEKALEDIEELKDSNRDMHYKNGNGG